MKKAKFMLAAIAVVGIVGGAFALNAKSSFSVFTINPAHTAAGCTVVVPDATLNSLDATGLPITTTSVSTASGVNCEFATIYPAN